MKKKFTILVILMLAFMTACGEKNLFEMNENASQNQQRGTETSNETTEAMQSESKVSAVIDTDTEWVIYWYLCGSDLESDYGAATDDLIEMLDVALPENVQVVIEAGGTDFWQNDTMNPDMLERYLYDSNGFTFLEDVPASNMGEVQTLVDFLKFGTENYPGKHVMVNFWNHGGGSIHGVCFDQQFDMDSLTLPELYEAFTTVFEENPGNQPIDIIGFDACLMATVDVAYNFSDLAKYMVASEEVEPGNGWYYTGIMNALAENPSIDALELATVICDSYVEGCEMEGTEDNITLSVTNLSEAAAMIGAYDQFGTQALTASLEDSGFYAQFARIAGSVENYGGNTREQGYYNLADLGHLAREAYAYLPEASQQVLSALENCIEYRVNGKYRAESTGLSCYYSYNGDLEELAAYSMIDPTDTFEYLYTYGLTGMLPEEGMEYISNFDYDTLPELQTLLTMDWDDAPVTVDEEGYYVLNLGESASDILSSVTFWLYYVSVEDDIMLCLGSDNDLFADWESGEFTDNFRGVWGSIDGALCYMELTYEGEDYNIYSVPVLLNGEEYNLMVVYDFTFDGYYIQGARKAQDEYGAADKNMISLVEGDEIQTLHYAASLSDDSEDLIAVAVDTIIVTADTSFDEMELGDGTFIMVYEMTDTQGNVAYSQPVTFETIDGQIYTSVE